MAEEKNPPLTARLDRTRFSDELAGERLSHQAQYEARPAAAHNPKGPMAFPYVIEPWRAAATVTLSGTVRGAAIAQTNVAIFHDYQWKPGFNRVWVGTNITELLFEKSDHPTLAAVDRLYATLIGRGREVFIVDRERDRAMARIYAVMMLHEGRTVYLCDTEAEAWRWLGLT